MQPRFSIRALALVSLALPMLGATGCRTPAPVSTTAPMAAERGAPPAYPLPPAPSQSEAAPLAKSTIGQQATTAPSPARIAPIQLVQGRAELPLPSEPVAQPMLRRLTIPPELPGADAPPIRLAPDTPEHPGQRAAAIERIFADLPALRPMLAEIEGPGGEPMTLDQLLDIARANNPTLRQARADVAAARGRAIDAGAYPNPQLGFEMDTVGTLGTAGYQGGMWNQTIKTANKLGLLRAAAMMGVRNAELALRKAQIDVATRTQAGYFAVLVAQESVRATRALSALTDESYRIQVEQLKGGEAAAYEPLQLRVLAMQARAAMVQAQNRHIAAWAELTATLGVTSLPPTILLGTADEPVPAIRHDAALAHVLAAHTDVLTAENTIVKSRFDLRYQEVVPIPDISTYVAVQKDYTGPPFATTVNLQAYVPVPILYRNQGGILNAQGALVRASNDVARVRNDLTSQLAAAYARYETTRTTVGYYRDMILPDQARAYRGIYERHQQQPAEVTFGDVVLAQQTLATTISQYLSALGDQWIAVTELARLLQVEQLSELSRFSGN